jgi:hypothetical protein
MPDHFKVDSAQALTGHRLSRGFAVRHGCAGVNLLRGLRQLWRFSRHADSIDAFDVEMTLP